LQNKKGYLELVAEALDDFPRAGLCLLMGAFEVFDGGSVLYLQRSDIVTMLGDKKL
jgi:hypothetical protein